MSRKNPFHEMLIALRAVRNLSQKDLALMVGYSPQYVSDIEHGRRAPSYEFVSQLVHTFNTSGPMRSEWMLAGARAHGWDI